MEEIMVCNVKNFNSFLKKINFDVDLLDKLPETKILAKDSISNIVVDNETALFNISRKIILDNEDNILLDCEFAVRIIFDSDVTKDNVSTLFYESKEPIVSTIFSDISLVISNITKTSSLGAVITPPIFIKA